MKFKLSVLVASAIAMAVMATIPAAAQQTSGSAAPLKGSSANSMRISPVRTDIALDPGSSKTIEVFAQNLTPTTVQVRAALSDFQASNDESGTPLVILDDEYAKSHSLRRLANIAPATLTLSPNQRASVKVTITAPKSAMAGGYYGAVRFLPADSADSEGSGVAVATNIGSLVLLKINGETKQDLKLESFDIRQKDKAGSFFKTPDDLKVVVRFNNKGNIQEQPFGKVQIKDRSGKIVEEHEINNTSPRGNVLPDSIRRFEVDLKKIGKFGKYTVEGNFGYGAGETITTKATFWVVPTTYIIGGIVGLLLLAGVIFLIVKVIVLSRGGRRPGPRRY